MNFSIATIIRRQIAPQHKISISWILWCKLLRGLRERGQDMSRESGAFLLSKNFGSKSHISEFILYDDLDPNCLNTGIIRFDGSYYSKLWDHCRENNLCVIADVHVHPGEAQQSYSDRDNPMISLKGHVALIIPNYVQHPVKLKKIGIYEYLGRKKWNSIPNRKKSKYFFIGF